ncbi:uncharacterized protein LOC136043820 [Artemia franciscana]|uniref:BTB domain-containing protein n=1 Tax=Artemia franciscana TaxID=6661 RepID=A0AA88HQJ6_ARTSF|nr:hypothetical protein QYM36_010048 [Artemia franciscana]
MNRVSGLVQILTNFNMEENPMITIQCEGGNIEAQKSLLVAVSDVFKAMLESDMLEKRTNLVLADDVNFETMKVIMDYYKEGSVSGFITMNRHIFTYIVEKYNFLCIKERIAEHLLQSYFINQDLRILESIFFTYGNQYEKTIVIKEIAHMIAKGRDTPDFVTEFNAPDFMELARYSCDALKNSAFDRFRSLLRTLYYWVYENSEERSAAVLEIVGMINMENFSRKNVQILLEKLPLSKKFKWFKLLLLKSFEHIDILEDNMSKVWQNSIKNSSSEECKSDNIKCKKCSHDSCYPFHNDPNCSGIHGCSRSFYVHKQSYACGTHISHPDKQIFK